jgi:hypothetical protein
MHCKWEGQKTFHLSFLQPLAHIQVPSPCIFALCLLIKNMSLMYKMFRYGACKGVVDITIWTSNTRYLTCRLFEVVHHIVVWKMDCGIIWGIFVNPLRDHRNNIWRINQHKLIGRVLAENLYINGRCIAMRNQDITIGLANSLINL